MPLSFVQEGKLVKLVDITGGKRTRMMLSDLGLIPGVEIEVIANSGSGPCILKVKGSKILLGRGMVSKIQVI